MAGKIYTDVSYKLQFSNKLFLHLGCYLFEGEQVIIQDKQKYLGWELLFKVQDFPAEVASSDVPVGSELPSKGCSTGG